MADTPAARIRRAAHTLEQPVRATLDRTGALSAAQLDALAPGLARTLAVDLERAGLIAHRAYQPHQARRRPQRERTTR